MNIICVVQILWNHFIYIIHLYLCIGMGHQRCFLWVHGGVSGLATSDPLTQMIQLALILLQLPSRRLTCTSRQAEKMTREKDLYIILQQPIRAKLYRWLLNLSFKNREASLLCFFATMTSIFGYLFTPVFISSRIFWCKIEIFCV